MRYSLVLGLALSALAVACGTSETSQDAARSPAQAETTLSECDYATAVGDQNDRLADAFTRISKLIDEPFSDAWLADYNGALDELRSVCSESRALAPPSSLTALHSDWTDITSDVNEVVALMTLDEELSLDPDDADYAVFTLVPSITERRNSLVLDLGEASATCGDGEGAVPVSRTEYSLRLGQVMDAVNQAGFGVADGFVAVSSCSSDEDCTDAGDLLVREYKLYIPVLEAEVDKLEGLEPPESYEGLHNAYLEQLRLRIEAGEMIIEGWESFDDALLERGFAKFREAQAKMSDILDELQLLMDE
jgi:hypothetical protein